MELGFKVLEHAAALIGRTPREVSGDAELLFQAQAAAFRLYRHQPLIAAIDHYNLAPEAYGGVVTQPDGPFSIASALVGFDQLLCDVAVEPDRVQSALMHLIEGQVKLTEHVRALGLEVAFAESAAGPPLLSPKLFREVELPVLKTLLAETGRIMGHPIACLMGGDTVRILDELLETGSPSLVCPHETDQAAFVKKLWDRQDIAVRVNLHSGIVARGNWDELRVEADRVLAFTRGRPNTVLGAGVLPYETRPENVFRLRDCVAPACRQTGTRI